MKTTMNATMLIHPTVTRAITGTLRKYGVSRQDMEDGLLEVQTRALEYLRGKPQPEAVEEWAAVCVTVAKHWRIDENDRRRTEQKYCVGPCEDPDEHVALERVIEHRDGVDARRMVEVLREQFEAGEMPEKGKEILDCVQAGLDYQETAAEVGLSAEAVRKRLKRMRELFKARLGTLGMTVMVVMLSMGAAGSAMAAPVAAPTAPPSTVPVPPPRASARPIAA